MIELESLHSFPAKISRCDSTGGLPGYRAWTMPLTSRTRVDRGTVSSNAWPGSDGFLKDIFTWSAPSAAIAAQRLPANSEDAPTRTPSAVWAASGGDRQRTLLRLAANPAMRRSGASWGCCLQSRCGHRAGGVASLTGRHQVDLDALRRFGMRHGFLRERERRMAWCRILEVDATRGRPLHRSLCWRLR